MLFKRMILSLVLISVSIFNSSISANELAILEKHKSIWKRNVQEFPCAPYTPSKKNCDPQKDIIPNGDMILFNALLCYSGEQTACDAVKNSQEQSGRWRRSPLHVGKPILHKSGSFSKDHVVGLLLWAISTPQQEEAKSRLDKWWQWAKESNSPQRHTQKISNQSYRDLVKGGLESMVRKECSGGETDVWADAWKCVKSILGYSWEHYIDIPMARVCEQTHCLAYSPGLYHLMSYVWEDLGDTPNYQNNPNMKFFRDNFDGVGYTFTRTKANHGQERYLQVVKAIIYDKLDQNVSKIFEHVKRKQPNNPHYQFLEGNTSYEDIADNLIQKCDSVSQPNYQTDNKGHQWAWQRDDKPDKDTGKYAWENSMGWDCIFIANLLGIPDIPLIEVAPIIEQDGLRINQVLSPIISILAN